MIHGRKLGNGSYMFSNAAALPPKPIDDRTHTTGLVVDPAHVSVECRSEKSLLNSSPDTAEDVPSAHEAVLGKRVVVLRAQRILISSCSRDASNISRPL